jgi:hypothetical protein
MSDTNISNFIVSYEGKDANIDIIHRDGKKFYNATQLYRTFGTGKESEKLPQFFLKDATRKYILQKYTELTVFGEKPKEIKELLNITDGNVLDNEAISKYLTSTHKENLPQEILKPFVYTKRGIGGGTYLSEPIFIEYAMQLSTQIKSVVIEVFRKYGWLEFLPQEKKVDALLDMTLQEEMKTVSEQYPTRNNESIQPNPFLADENTTVENEDADLFQTRLAADATIRSLARLQGKFTTKMLQTMVFQILQNEKKVFASKEEEHKYLKDYYTTLFDTMYLALFNHRAKEMQGLIDQIVKPRDAMPTPCLLIVQRAEANIASELLGLFQTKKVLTISALKTLVIQCCEQPAADLFKHSKAIDFLLADKKIPKTNQIKQIDVTLDDTYKTQIKTNIVELPKKEKVKKITNKTTKALALQPSLFDDTEF